MFVPGGHILKAIRPKEGRHEEEVRRKADNRPTGAPA